MKTITSLALLWPLLSFAQAEAPLPSLRLDLDGDGKPDMVEVVSLEGDKKALRISLSGTRQVLVFKGILQKFSCEYCGVPSLKASGPKSFALSGAGNDSQAGAAIDSAAFSYENGQLRANSFHYTYWGHHHDESAYPTAFVSVDFNLRTVTYETAEEVKPKVVKERLRETCAPTLADFEGGEKPDCAAQQAMFIREEISTPAGWPAPCPSLNGIYVCRAVPGHYGRAYNGRRSVIKRSQGAVNSYDVSIAEHPFLADGKAHIVRDSGGYKEYSRGSCKRELLVAEQIKWMSLSKGDARKPFYDKMPWFKNKTTWTQLDLLGNHFLYKEENFALDDDKNDGSYRMTLDFLEDCVKLDEQI